MAAQIGADIRRVSTESWAKYFISTDAGIKFVTQKLFCIVLVWLLLLLSLVWFGLFSFICLVLGFFFLFSFLLFAGSHSISFISVSTQPLAIFWGGQGEKND